MADGKDDLPRHIRLGNVLLVAAEDVIYVGIAVLLCVAAGVLLFDTATDFADLGSGNVDDIVVNVLDRLLLIFIVVELLFAVRVILRKREIIAEPFLIVGNIASIKEIIVLSVEAAELLGDEQQFQNAVLEIGILGVLVLVLAGAAVLLRAKEREPEEGDQGERRREERDDSEALGVPGAPPTD
ncbi:MAG: phosphate-starvation-inducible PsiE family protein [Actinomycetes bacterium]